MVRASGIDLGVAQVEGEQLRLALIIYRERIIQNLQPRLPDRDARNVEILYHHVYLEHGCQALNRFTVHSVAVFAVA